jgi:hypothetical protein
MAFDSFSPAFVNTFKKSAPSGNAFTDSGKYRYAELSFEKILPISGVMYLK